MHRSSKPGTRVRFPLAAPPRKRQTAERRAYLAGEGKKRQEWGESLVIVNKRGGHPCPHCVKWVGKILIDDVYSGGEPDGKHQLLSEAMAQGFLHPRCRDGFTTYFPGVTTVPDPAAEQEIRAGAEAEQQEAREQYAGRMAERWERRAKYSLDPGNKRAAEARAAEWRESVANGKGSDIIKNISLEDFQKVNAGRIEDGVIQCVYDAMQEFNSTNLFHSAKVVETYKNVAFQTEVVRVGTFADVVLNINSNFFGGLSLAEANNMFNNAASTVCNSVRDGVVHEIYHAKLVMGRNFSQIEALYDELSDIHLSGISPTAMQDGTELVAEIGVLIERGEYDSVPEEAKIIFEKYLGG